MAPQPFAKRLHILNFSMKLEMTKKSYKSCSPREIDVVTSGAYFTGVNPVLEKRTEGGTGERPTSNIEHRMKRRRSEDRCRISKDGGYTDNK